MAVSEARIKERVRERDGYRCRDCRATDEDSRAASGLGLEVHRLVPGIEYNERWCVTLCHDCHRRMPRNIEDAVFKENSGVVFFFFNLYCERDARVMETLESVAQERGVHVADVLNGIVDEWMLAQPADYSI